MRNYLTQASRVQLMMEWIVLFLGVPSILYFYATRWNMVVILWLMTAYALIYIHSLPQSSWRILWHGEGWDRTHQRTALLRFLTAATLLAITTWFVFPYRLFSFPLQRPFFWLLVMVLYPLLSALPQELIFRSFFFRRYAPLFSHRDMMLATSALCFGYVHIIFHNAISPLLCVMAGAAFSHSYEQHKSLKWAFIEHAAYGCMVFTIGLGFYFFLGGTHG